MSELQTTARPYAKALFKSAKENNALEKNFDMLKNLKVILCDENIKAIVSNDSFDNKYKVSLLTGVLEESFDENFARFISLLAENNRLLVIDEIICSKANEKHRFTSTEQSRRNPNDLIYKHKPYHS